MTTTAEQDGTPGTVGVTIKYGKGYEDTWFNARGTVPQVRGMVVDYFGMSAEETEGLTLSEIVTNATTLAHAKGTLGSQLGATVLNTGHASRNAANASGGDRSRSADQAAKNDDSNGLDEAITAEIETAKDVESLKLVYGKNKPVFDSKPELLEKWKARGRKLTGK